jgi:hypothetical protein
MLSFSLSNHAKLNITVTGIVIGNQSKNQTGIAKNAIACLQAAGK